MKVGLIVWSATGNTLSVAESFADTLTADGHTVTIEKIAIDAPDPARRPETWTLTIKPDPSPYDALVFGSPVEAFSLSGVMNRYLSEAGDLAGKPVFTYVTQYFPKPWMGGANAVKQLAKLVEKKGGAPCGMAVINWSSKKKLLQIETARINLSKIWHP
ncbi:MAG TPA: hypothetical protein PLP41_10420 [Treponemataceae bacterium]|nr:hypothetical protein [Treponemataceae bacterium]